MISTLTAIGLMFSGFALFALFYFLRTDKWNGFAAVPKLMSAAAIMIIMCILLVNVPDVSGFLKSMTGLDVSVDDSKGGFLTIGFAISGIVSSRLNSSTKFNNQKNDKK